MAKKNILVCPLDWGLGHASRCIPLVQKLLDFNFNVIIAADNRPYDLLKNEFPNLQFVRLPAYKISYPRKGSMSLKMLFSIPGILKGTYKEHKLLKRIIKEHDVEVVVSDNRFGLWNKKIISIFISHQLMIKCPRSLKLLEPVLHWLNLAFINKYDECWVPDYEGKINLSGDLSHKYDLPSNAWFIGPLSKFHSDDTILENIDAEEETKHDVIFILSGPEPQRSMFEERIITQLKSTAFNAIIVQGKTEKYEEYDITEKITVFSYLKSAQLREYIRESRLVICRPGYSSIMDLSALGKNAVFIPTPGQTEQEYLANYFLKNNIYYAINQKKFDITNAIDQSEFYSGVALRYNEALLNDRIKGLKYRLN